MESDLGRRRLLIVMLAGMLAVMGGLIFWVSGGLPVMTGWYRSADSLTQQLPINNAQYMFERANEYDHSGDTVMAQAAARRATIIDPGFVPAHKFLAAQALKSRDFDTAAKESRSVLQIQPDDGTATIALATAYENMGQKDRAEEIYRNAMEKSTFENTVRDRARKNLQHMMVRPKDGSSVMLPPAKDAPTAP